MMFMTVEGLAKHTSATGDASTMRVDASTNQRRAKPLKSRNLQHCPEQRVPYPEVKATLF